MASKKEIRQRRIIEELNFRPGLRIADLAEHLAVSAETVRRDLGELTDEGLVERTYGGAIVRQSTQEPVLNERHHLMIEERRRIARLAMPVLKGCRYVMIGSGATTMHVARRLAYEMNHVTVLTHSFGVATVLSLNPTIRVIMLPGDYHAGEGALHGATTLRFLETYHADWAILGASGLDEEGPSDALIEAAEVYAMMIRRSAQTMVVADSSKFDQRFTSRYASWDEVDALVTERRTGSTLERTLKERGVRIANSDD
ncbi:DeoR/GlpR family DNA-binding transcription regulator [Kushneria aurantia]|uniref:DeoR/GlpR family DNA-binding transcription regulator n=1 Tax=Kushneria aurantia TaxID=504092 RepID=A0ABV6G810_9GAMM|nr:DeoR/GlpR family DNA-binding transcription regulator [Kushneria aurantia]